MKNYKLLTVLALGLIAGGASVPANAEGSLFSHAGISYLSASVAPETGTGYEIEGSFDLDGGFFVYGSYASIAFLAGNENVMNLGGGMYFKTSNGFAYVRATYKSMQSGLITGYTIGGGYKMHASEKFELDGFVGLTSDNAPSNGTILSVSGTYDFGGVGLLVGYETDSSFAPSHNTVKIGARVSL